MNWFPSRENIITQTLSEVMEGVRFVRPDFYQHVKDSSSFEFGKAIAFLFNNQIITLESKAAALNDELFEARNCEQRIQAKYASTRVTLVKQYRAQITDLESKLEALNKSLLERDSTILTLERQITELDEQLDNAENIITGQNRLIAQQNQQLLDLLGEDFRRP
jgi:chromosome segregation ATPase